MHRDKKLGLALGILLIGAVGAFFFRNEKGQPAEIPELEDRQAIDERILEQEGSLPYLERIEPAAPSDNSNSVADSLASSRDAATPLGGTTAPPDPIRPASTAHSPSETAQNSISIPIPEQSGRRTATVSRDSRPSQLRSTEASVDATLSSEMRRHKVKSGETLTGLAARYLGSSARFMELYEANRDQLKSPNDLRAGITIRIPNRSDGNPPALTGDDATPGAETGPLAPLPSFLSNDDPPAKPAAENATETSAPQQPTATERDSRPKRHRFVPARNPLMPGRVGNLPLQSTELPEELRPTYRDPADVRAQENLARPNPRVVIPDELPQKNGESADPQPEPRTYRVRRGDSLEKIAVRFYGDAAATQRIFAANRDRLNRRNYLREGMTLVLP